MSVRRIEIQMHPNPPVVVVDGDQVACNLRVTYKRDGSLSTLRIGNVEDYDNLIREAVMDAEVR